MAHKSISAGSSIKELIAPGKALVVETADPTAVAHVSLLKRDGVTVEHTTIVSAPEETGPKQFGPYGGTRALRIDGVTGLISYRIGWASPEQAMAAWLAGTERA